METQLEVNCKISNKMKIGIDVHGTIDTNPLFFNNFIRKAQKNGTAVYVISGPPIVDIKKTLNKIGISANNVFVLSVVDYLKKNKAPMWEKANGWWADDETWWASKAKMCKEYGINVLIDDKIEYAVGFNNDDMRFILYKPGSPQLLYLL